MPQSSSHSYSYPYPSLVTILTLFSSPSAWQSSHPPISHAFTISTPLSHLHVHPHYQHEKDDARRRRRRYEHRMPTLSSSSPLTSLYSSNNIDKDHWLPSLNVDEDDIFARDVERDELEEQSIAYLVSLIQNRLSYLRQTKTEEEESETSKSVAEEGEMVETEETASVLTEYKGVEYARGRFRDLTCTKEGEIILEQLFDPRCNNSRQEPKTEPEEQVVRGAIVALQSLLILGTQVGIKGTIDFQKRAVSHLADSYRRQSQSQYFSSTWTDDDIKSLKHAVDATAGTHVLAALLRKRSARGAFDLLYEMGVFARHEDLALLRSGFPVRFTEEEEDLARSIADSSQVDVDIDSVLDIRADLTHLKVYTIDGASTRDIDDGLSVEKIVVRKEDGTEEEGYRYWIHIADVDRYAPRHSPIFRVAQKRFTSLYLPTHTVPMFPSILSTGVMSLGDCHHSNHTGAHSGVDSASKSYSCALSLAVELHPDGSIIPSSIQIVPSKIDVSYYRLTYDEVDEMLDYGTAYFEEWELGALLAAATSRRKFRIANGSSEGFVPNPIPQCEVKAVLKTAEGGTDASSTRGGDVGRGDTAPIPMMKKGCDEEEDEYDIIVNVEVTHNAGRNQTTTSSSLSSSSSSTSDDYAAPVSSAFLLVTEMMILAGEAMGKSRVNFLPTNHNNNDDDDDGNILPLLDTTLQLPYRSQPKPDLNARYQEVKTMESLGDRGGGYCQAWFARRFFEPVQITQKSLPHCGLGLDCYVQWTSPIRRFGDLQVHAAVKRSLRRKRVNELMNEGRPIPEELRSWHLGCDDIPREVVESLDDGGRYRRYDLVPCNGSGGDVDNDANRDNQMDNHEIDYRRGGGFLRASRVLQRKSRDYWLFEYIRRMVEDDNADEEVAFESVVLGCVDPRRHQYAIYVHELGLEHRYLSEKGQLRTGETIWLKVANLSPSLGLLTFTLASRNSGKASSSSTVRRARAA